MPSNCQVVRMLDAYTSYDLIIRQSDSRSPWLWNFLSVEHLSIQHCRTWAQWLKWVHIEKSEPIFPSVSCIVRCLISHHWSVLGSERAEKKVKRDFSRKNIWCVDDDTQQCASVSEKLASFNETSRSTKMLIKTETRLQSGRVSYTRWWGELWTLQS